VSNHIAFISLQKRFNLKVLRIKNLSDNEVDLVDLENLIKKHKPKLVAVTHIPTSSGLIQNIEGVGKICKMNDILYLVDACQSVGQINIDVQKIGCDFLTATGRKFLRGPRGTGFLYVSKRVLDSNLTPLFVDLRGAVWTDFDDFQVLKDAKRFEHWEMSYSSLVGLTEAVRYANIIGLKNIEKYNSQLSQTLRLLISENPKLKILDKGNSLCSIITFCKSDGDISEITRLLNDNSVCFSVSKKEYALIDFTNKKIDSAVRLSPHYFNTTEEIYELGEILTKVQ
jgi:selenocysteine lyase/cysteine desulfurase